MALDWQTIRDQMDAQLWGRLAEDLARAKQQEYLERVARIQEAWKAYEGKHPESIRHNAAGVDYNTPLNLCRTIVDKGVSFLFGQGVDIEIDAETGDEESPEAEYLSRFWGDDKSYRLGRKSASKEVVLQRLGMNGAIGGHCFVKLQPSEQDDGEPPRILLLDPINMEVDTARDDVNTVDQYVYTWLDLDPQTGKPTAYRQRTRREDDETWLIIDEKSRGNQWELVQQTTWPYPWAPISDCQNLPMPNEFWGVSDLEHDVLKLQYAINGVSSDIRKILSLYAFPAVLGKMIGQRYASEWGSGKMITSENADAALEFVEMQNDGAFVLAYYDKLRSVLHEVTEIPEVATGKLDNVGPLSGAALSILYGPIVDKTTKKRGTYGDMIEELSVHALVLGGYAEVDVNLAWPDIIPQDQQAAAAVVRADQQIGVSNTTLMRQRGYDPEVEQDQKNQELRDQQAAFDAGLADGGGTNNVGGSDIGGMTSRG